MKTTFLAIGPAILLALILVQSATLGAPPPNDHFANRINLGSAAPVSTTGTNVDASMEAGEDDFGGIAGGSVWYEWTAPSTGWVTVYTYGSELDTVIGIYTGGSTIASLTRAGFNDGDHLVVRGGFNYPSEFDPDAGIHPSRLYFRAQAGTTYKIAVCGWYFDLDVDMNTFDLGIKYETPGGQVTSVTMSPDPVNVTASSQTVTVTVSADIANPAPFSMGSIYAYPPGSASSGNWFDSAWQFKTIQDTDRVSGSPTSGVYEVDITIPRYAVPGDWIVDVYLSDLSASGQNRSWLHGSGTDLMEDFVIAIPAQDTRLTVQNTGPSDTAGPVLQSFTPNPASANVTAGSQVVTITMRITDNLAGATTMGPNLVLRTDSLSGIITGPPTLISGDALDGVYEVAITLPQGFPSGTHYWGLEVFDQTGNRRAYSVHPFIYDGPFPAGISSTYTVTGSVGYEAWKFGRYFGFPAEEGLLDDPNDDGVKNLACFAFNLQPLYPPASVMPDGGFEGLPRISTMGSGASQRLSIQFVRRKASTNSGLTYLPQFGDSLAETGPGSFTNATGTPVIEDIDPTWERVTIEDSVTGAARRFGRVKINYTSP